MESVAVSYTLQPALAIATVPQCGGPHAPPPVLLQPPQSQICYAHGASDASPASTLNTHSNLEMIECFVFIS
jgi:hypothetical protein